MLVLFSQPFSRHFHAPLCSTATFILIVYHVLWIIVPYIIAYSTKCNKIKKKKKLLFILTLFKIYIIISNV